MAEGEIGAIFTQQGVSVQGAADYQKVLDSRWRFMEVEIEQLVTVVLPARAATATIADRYFDDITVVDHNLGFFPAFETNDTTNASILSDGQRVFVRRIVSTGGQPASTLTLKVRVYNLPITTEYVAIKEFVAGSSSPESSVGIEFLDGKAPGVALGDVSPVGFSADTRKKILSIHRHGVQYINPWASNTVNVTAVDTAGDVLTMTPRSGDFAWFSRLGQAIKYTPSDFVTMPAPLIFNTTYYVIPLTSTTCKLATTYANALAGIAIDLTTTGALPGIMATVANPSISENVIKHDIGYPPTYQLAQIYPNSSFIAGAPGENIGPLLNTIPGIVTADNINLAFVGVQNVFTGKFAYIILKDPVELSK